jgi:hypothetical protein
MENDLPEMNEDDTFRRLKRLSFEDVQHLCAKLLVRGKFYGSHDEYVKAEVAIINEHGWTMEEWDAECERRDNAAA